MAPCRFADIISESGSQCQSPSQKKQDEGEVKLRGCLHLSIRDKRRRQKGPDAASAVTRQRCCHPRARPTLRLSSGGGRRPRSTASRAGAPPSTARSRGSRPPDAHFQAAGKKGRHRLSPAPRPRPPMPRTRRRREPATGRERAMELRRLWLLCCCCCGCCPGAAPAPPSGRNPPAAFRVPRSRGPSRRPVPGGGGGPELTPGSPGLPVPGGGGGPERTPGVPRASCAGRGRET